MNTKKYLGGLAIVVAFVGLSALPALAQTNNTGPNSQNRASWQQNGRSGPMMGSGKDNKGTMMGRGIGGPIVFGQVTAISGNTITVLGRSGTMMTPNVASTTYTVDATNSKVTKYNDSSTVSAIVVGDTIVAQGTLNGTTLTATYIHDGLMMKRGGASGINKNGTSGQGFEAVKGNGQPVIAGTVSTVSGTSLTIANSGNQNYVVDASNAKITKLGITNATIANIVTGDHVVVQGTINGTSITAATIVDQPAVIASVNGNNTTPVMHPGFFGSIGSFFKNFFGI